MDASWPGRTRHFAVSSGTVLLIAVFGLVVPALRPLPGGAATIRPIRAGACDSQDLDRLIATAVFAEAIMNVFADESVLDRRSRAIPPGGFAVLEDAERKPLGLVTVNPNSKIVGRVMAPDPEAVIDAANSQPFSHIHRPGVAVGGHCIPVYPRFYLGSDDQAQIPATAREVNSQMPAYAVDLLEQELGSLDGERVLILGVAYRGNVKET